MSTRIARSSGNVHRDLGLAILEEHALKAGLVRRIDEAFEEKGLNKNAPA